MVAALLCLRHHHPPIVKKINAESTKLKRSLAWQYFANVLLSDVDAVLTSEQVSELQINLCVWLV